MAFLPVLWRVALKNEGARRYYLATARSFDNAVTGLGSEIFMRVPQTEQFTQPACSTTEGTVLNLRMHLGHWTSTIWTNWRPWLVDLRCW